MADKQYPVHCTNFPRYVEAECLLEHVVKEVDDPCRLQRTPCPNPRRLHDGPGAARAAA